jgi:acyl-coenzyme A thioesterase PaaI-like protein
MTEIEPVSLADAASVEPAGEDRFTADLASQFTFFGYPNGGYLQCVVANAALAAASDAGAAHLHATAVSSNFISSGPVGPAQLDTQVRRVGRGASFVHVSLRQGEALTMESLVTVGTLSESSQLRYQSSSPPALAPWSDCVDLPVPEGMPIYGSVHLRADPDSPQWWNGERGPGEISLWMRLKDAGGPWDPGSLFLALDALPPATLLLGSNGWVPTLQLTSYVRRIPSSEWLRARQWCVVVADGLVDERCELFDDNGEMVACSSQLAMVRFAQSSS